MNKALWKNALSICFSSAMAGLYAACAYAHAIKAMRKIQVQQFVNSIDEFHKATDKKIGELDDRLAKLNKQ